MNFGKEQKAIIADALRMKARAIRSEVIADDDDTFLGIGPRAAACGLRPAHGWGLDMFIKDKCARCRRVLGEG